MNRRCAVVAAVALVALSWAGAASVAYAQTSGGGELGPGYVRATAADLGAGTFPGGGLPASAPSVESPLRWVTSVERSFCVLPGSPVPAELLVPVGAFGALPFFGAPPGTVFVTGVEGLPPDAVVIGRILLDLGVSVLTGEIVAGARRCDGPAMPGPPVAPSATEVWEQTPLPRAVVHASPPGTRDWPGITRLGTDFSSARVPPTTAFVTLDGYDVDVVAVPVAYAWSFGDGTTVVADDPSAVTRVAYLRRGEFAVTRYVVWHGTAHLRWFGFELGDEDLGTVTIPERIVYRVSEIRAVLRTTRARG